MRSSLLIIAMLLTMAGIGAGQQANMTLSSYMVDQPAAVGVGLTSPIAVTTMTDCPIQLNIQAFPNANGYPVVMLYDFATTLGNTISIGAWVNYNFQIDLRDRGSNGYAGDQILFNGFTNPSPSTWTNSGGQLSTTITLPACLLQSGALNCITASNASTFEVSSQAIVYDITNAPFNVRSTAASQGTFTNGYQQFTLSGEASGTFSFKQGFTFKFYGTNYTSAFVSANGFVSFGQQDTSFPTITVATIRGPGTSSTPAPPRIMNFYNDLVPEDMSYAPASRIYARQFCENGVRKIRFVHNRLAEFSNTTGPHGGECVITENDDIEILVHNYQIPPSINTAVGITPGNGIGPSISGFGVDLSAKSGTNFSLGAGVHGFEVYQYFPSTANAIDVIGLTITFLKNVALANTTPSNSGYIIQ